jgi:hypothetical protein
MLVITFDEANFPKEWLRKEQLKGHVKSFEEYELQPSHMMRCKKHGNFQVLCFQPSAEDIKEISEGKPIWVIANFQGQVGKIEAQMEKPEFEKIDNIPMGARVLASLSGVNIPDNGEFVFHHPNYPVCFISPLDYGHGFVIVAAGTREEGEAFMADTDNEE